jgi:hypothetical protein
MADNLGPNQTRVLDSANTSFESVVYQKKKPPLSCEENLAYALTSDHVRSAMHASMPSGWEVIGTIQDDTPAGQCLAGDVITSSTFAANTFRLIALDKGIQTGRLTAWVNGYKITVQGTNSLDENNIIILPVPPTITYRVDFVFLEVYRALLKPSGVMYKYGNVLYGGINPTNDLIDPAAGFETSLRVQVQYRIRVAPVDIISFPSGFDPYNVFAQGTNVNPLTCALAAFVPVPGDPGLWRAGNGDSASQTTLGTVDGYAYAIPMFAVTRRNTGAYDPDNRTNGAGKALADYVAGYASDRPDNRYNNWIVSDDILDMRSLIQAESDLKGTADKAFWMLAKGDVRGTVGYSDLGEDHVGVVLTQADAISYVDHVGSNWRGGGDGARRTFAAASVTQPDTLYRFDQRVWHTGDASVIPISGLYSSSTIVEAIQGAWKVSTLSSDGLSNSPSTQLGLGTDYTYSGIGTHDATFIARSGLDSSNVYVIVDYILKFPASPTGFTSLPTTFLEARREDSSRSFALTREPIRVRQAAPVIAADGTARYNTLSNHGCSTTEYWDFGHQMTYHALGAGNQQVTIPRTVNGYRILGVVSAAVDGTNRSNTSVSRNVTYYTIDLGSPAVAVNADVELVLYTGSDAGVTGDKFFQVSRQGRGITDTYEMREVSLVGNYTSSYTIDTQSLTSPGQTILAIASNYNLNIPPNPTGYGIAYVGGVQTTLLTSNRMFPTDTTQALLNINFSSTILPGTAIQVPLLMRTAITTTEGFTFFYKTLPYQGLSDSTVLGSVVATGPAIVTTAGSGAITDLVYSEGTAKFVSSTTVTGRGVKWLANVREGDVIIPSSHPYDEYRILSIPYDTQVI